MDIGQAATLAGATILVGLIVEAIKRALAWGQAQVDRFGPLFSMAVGIIVVLLLTAATTAVTLEVLAAGIVTGILAGAAASGLYDAVPKPTP